MLRNRVWQTTTGSGTGSLTLGSVLTGFQAFSTAFGTSVAIYYISSRDYSEWECGWFTVNVNTLARSSGNVINGSNGPGALVSFTGSGVKDVTNDVPAEILLGRKSADIASSSSIDLGATIGEVVDVTGTTTITSLGTVQAGVQRLVRFTGALTLTHNATSLILPTGANITTQAGDRALLVSLGSGNWLCGFYQRSDGTPVSGTDASRAADNAVVKLAGSNLSGPVNANKGSNLASASTVNLGAATGEFVHITGTTTITAFDTVQAGTERTVVFDGSLILTHNATSLILPTGANITTAAGDAARFRSEGSGNWRCVAYQLASGSALVGGAGGVAYAQNFALNGFPG